VSSIIEIVMQLEKLDLSFQI